MLTGFADENRARRLIAQRLMRTLVVVEGKPSTSVASTRFGCDPDLNHALRGPQVGLCLRNATTAPVIAGSIAAGTVWRAELRWTNPAAPKSRYRLSHL